MTNASSPLTINEVRKLQPRETSEFIILPKRVTFLMVLKRARSYFGEASFETLGRTRGKKQEKKLAAEKMRMVATVTTVLSDPDDIFTGEEQ